MKYLKFASESEAKSVLSAHVQEGEWVQASHTHALDVIGQLPPVLDEEGNIIKAGDSGFHINYVGDADLSAYEVFPLTPHRIFA